MKALWAPVVVMLAAGCVKRVDSPEGAGSRSAAAYYPLAVGNRWTYQVKFLGEQDKRQVEILREDDGFFIDSQGGRITVDAFGVRDQKRYLLREPVEAGRTWTNVVSVSSVEHYRILEAGMGCEVPAGKFQDCVKVESRNQVDENTTLVGQFTFAPGVGIVKIEVAAEKGGKRIPQTVLALESFRLMDGRSASGPGR